MPVLPIERILRDLDSGDPEEAWTEFLRDYAALMFQVVRYFESDPTGLQIVFNLFASVWWSPGFGACESLRPSWLGQMKGQTLAPASGLPSSRLRRK